MSENRELVVGPDEGEVVLRGGFGLSIRSLVRLLATRSLSWSTRWSREHSPPRPIRTRTKMSTRS